VYDSVSSASDRAAAAALDTYLAGGSGASTAPNEDEHAERMRREARR
jgi:hypothetical protein